MVNVFFFFFSSRRRHTRSDRDWSSDVCSSDLVATGPRRRPRLRPQPGLPAETGPWLDRKLAPATRARGKVAATAVPTGLARSPRHRPPRPAAATVRWRARRREPATRARLRVAATAAPTVPRRRTNRRPPPGLGVLGAAMAPRR